MSTQLNSTFLSSMKELFQNKLRTYQREMRCRKMNLPAWLLILFSIVAGTSVEVAFNIIFSLTTHPESTSCFAVVPESGVNMLYVVFTVQNSLFFLLYPFTGWLADTVIGRKKAVTLSLWLCWFGTLLQCISYCIQYGTCGLPVNIAKYGISSIALLLLIMGTAGFFTNIPAYGLDQLAEKSNTHSRAFIHWTIWGLFVGFLIGYIAFVEKSIYDAELLQITGIIACAFTSIALCLHSWFYNNHHEAIDIQKNPYKMVYNVLKYSWYHKAPERRSALTYWENKAPSRMDFGKIKYGGPFLEEDVESVKTFWRIVAVLLSTFGFFIPYYPTVTGVLTYTNLFEGATSTLSGYGSFALWQAFDSQIILLIPVLELIIIPLFPKIEYFLLNPLRGIGFCYILILIALISMIVLNTVGHFIAPGDNIIQLSFLYYSIPLLFSGLADSLSFMYGLEFICSQAPANMSGMLLGIFWFIRVLYINIGCIFSLWNVGGPGKIPDTFWVLILQVIVCAVGMIVYVLVARWYQRRRKDEDYDVHTVVEETYDRVLSIDTSFKNNYRTFD